MDREAVVELGCGVGRMEVSRGVENEETAAGVVEDGGAGAGVVGGGGGGAVVVGNEGAGAVVVELDCATEEVVVAVVLVEPQLTQRDESEFAKSGKASHVNTTLLQMNYGMHTPDVP